MIVPLKKMMSCPVLCCYSDVPDVFPMCPCASRCCCIVPAFLYVMSTDVFMWQVCYFIRFHAFNIWY